jgi:hypothetical protein
VVVVRAADINEQFDALLSGERTREEVEAWAAERMRAEDEGRLTYAPPADEERLWEAITYLLGVGLRDAPDRYLLDPEDLLDFRRAHGL